MSPTSGAKTGIKTGVRNGPLPDRHSLITKALIRVLPVTILVLVGIGVLTLHVTQSTLQRNVETTLTELANHQAKLLALRLESISQQAAALATNELVVNGLVDIQARSEYLPTFFTSLKVAAPVSATISLLDYRGRTITSNTEDPIDVPVQQYHQGLWNDVSHSFSANGFLFSAPVLLGGQAEGRIVIHFAPETLPELLEIATTSATAVIGPRGTILSSTDPAFAVVGEDVSMLKQGDWVVRESLLPAGTGLYLVSATNSAVAFATVAKLQTALGVGFGLAILSLIVGIALTAILTTLPLGHLMKQLARIRGLEDMREHLDEKGPSEIRSLIRVFNQLQDQLGATATSLDTVERILDGMPGPVIVTSLTGRILLANKSAEELLSNMTLGGKQGVVTGENLQNCLSPLLGWTEREAFAAFMDPLSDTRSLETSFNLLAEGDGSDEKPVPDDEIGDICTLLWTRSSLLSDSGDRNTFVYAALDISERKKAERLKSEFVSVVSHELRTPLTAIAGSLGLMDKGAVGPLEPKAANLVGIANRNVSRLVRLINDILDIQKIEAGRMIYAKKPVSLGEVVHDSCEATLPLGRERGIDFNIDLHCPDDRVMGDPDRLQQVVTNLLSNAIKFSPDQGTVSLRVSCQCEPSGCGTGQERITIAVSDQGPGIPEEFHDRLFQTFAQADSSTTRRKDGTGLGLAIVKAIVEAHEGQIGFETSAETGTTFWIAIPTWFDPAKQKDGTAPDGAKPAVAEKPVQPEAV